MRTFSHSVAILVLSSMGLSHYGRFLYALHEFLLGQTKSRQTSGNSLRPAEILRPTEILRPLWDLRKFCYGNSENKTSWILNPETYGNSETFGNHTPLSWDLRKLHPVTYPTAWGVYAKLRGVSSNSYTGRPCRYLENLMWVKKLRLRLCAQGDKRYRNYNK